ncbi:transglycosylase [Brevundimonas sp. NPDC092305]|uniref:transglycosylase n=1 Tax=Brevundimonas sp. NPDC092305 TaxID=3363957 RepID=UPI0038182D6B
MPRHSGEIESLYRCSFAAGSEPSLQYADIAIAALGAFFLAWLADTATGRRGLFAASLVSGVAAVCGWFLSVRVFAVSTSNQWTWVLWSLVGSVLALFAFHLFRNKR